MTAENFDVFFAMLEGRTSEMLGHKRCEFGEFF